PVNYRKAALGNLITGNVPMTGQIPIDTSAPNVALTPDGGLYIDSTPIQNVWRRWADGDFHPVEESMARILRSDVQNFDAEAVREQWKDFAQENFTQCSDLKALILN